MEEKNVEYSLDVIEIFFEETFSRLGSTGGNYWEAKYFYCCDKLNARFKQHGVGYALIEGKIIRIDNEFIHAEVIKPTLLLLHEKKYATAQKEYLAAHKHFRQGDYAPCITEAAKAFESTMKIIADERGWPYNHKDAARKLAQAVFDNNLLLSNLQTYLSSIRTTLENGSINLRNEVGAHGGGVKTVVIPEYFAAFVLGSTAAAIKLLADAHREEPR